MNIVVCVKQVPAVNEQRLDPVTGTVIREGVASILNPFDTYAVEEAVRLRRKLGGKVTAVSMGVPSAEATLKRVLAVGVDAAVLLTDRAFAGADTLATARTLSLAVKKLGGADLILCGRMATDGDTAQVGPMLAEWLDLPHASDVSAIEKIERGEIAVRRMTDEGYRRVRLPLACVLSVVKEINVPGLPSVSGVLRAQRAQVTRWDAADLGAAKDEVGQRGSRTRVVSTQRPRSRAACRMLSGCGELMDVLRQEKRL